MGSEVFPVHPVLYIFDVLFFLLNESCRGSCIWFSCVKGDHDIAGRTGFAFFGRSTYGMVSLEQLVKSTLGKEGRNNKLYQMYLHQCNDGNEN